jgi:Ceramidase
MDWSEPIDLYCERTDPGFWAEPLNGVSNLAFLLAAAAAFVRWRRAGASDWLLLLLIIITGLVGIGSFIFHTMATRGAALLDVVPIALFIYSYLFLALRRFFRLPLIASVCILAAFAALSYGLQEVAPPDLLNGSYGYLPALIAMLVVGLLRRNETSGRMILAAAGALAVSLIFRTIDLAVCDAFPLGTHFLWHGLNGVALYWLLRAALNRVACPDHCAGASAPMRPLR